VFCLHFSTIFYCTDLVCQFPGLGSPRLPEVSAQHMEKISCRKIVTVYIGHENAISAGEASWSPKIFQGKIAAIATVRSRGQKGNERRGNASQEILFAVQRWRA